MLPRKLKNMNLFIDAVNYAGLIGEMTLPNLSLNTEDWRAGGMLGPVKIDNGLEAMELEFTLGGYSEAVTTQFGTGALDGTLLRAMGAFQSDADSSVTPVEVVMRGRHTQLDRGNWKPGGDTEFKVKTAIAYYKETVNGETLIEIDMVAGIFMVAGVDRYAEIRAAIGA